MLVEVVVVVVGGDVVVVDVDVVVVVVVGIPISQVVGSPGTHSLYSGSNTWFAPQVRGMAPIRNMHV